MQVRIERRNGLCIQAILTRLIGGSEAESAHIELKRIGLIQLTCVL